MKRLETPQEMYLSIREVADLLQIDYSTARRWLAKGRLPSVYIAGHVAGYADEIRALAKQLDSTVSIAEVAARVGLSTRMINHLITETEELEAIKWMRRWYVYESSVEEYLKKRSERLNN